VNAYTKTRRPFINELSKPIRQLPHFTEQSNCLGQLLASDRQSRQPIMILVYLFHYEKKYDEALSYFNRILHIIKGDDQTDLWTAVLNIAETSIENINWILGSFSSNMACNWLINFLQKSKQADS